MLVKYYLSNTANLVSAFAVVLVVSGFVCATPCWAMGEEEGPEESHTTTIMSLADETLLKIMDYRGMPLTALSLLSKRFHSVSHEKTLTRTIHIDTEEKLEKALSNSMDHPFPIRQMKFKCLGKLGDNNLRTLLATYPSLTSLDLSDYEITDEEGALAIFSTLQSDNALTSLALRCVVSDYRKQETVYAALGEVIIKNPNLRVLNLSRSMMNEGLAKLCEALPSSHVEILDLSCYTFSFQSVPHISGVLKGKSPIKELNLSYNVLKNSDVEKIASALKENTSLEKLWMDNVRFEDSGALAFSEAIQAHPTLKFLSLSCYSPSEKRREFLRDIALKGKEQNIKVEVGFKL